MRKKLAIFTLVVGFFTLCNVVLYTKRLRAEEMTRFWHWSAVALQPMVSNCSSGALAQQQQQFDEAIQCVGNGSAAVYAAPDVTTSVAISIPVASATSTKMTIASVTLQLGSASNATTTVAAPSPRGGAGSRGNYYSTFPTSKGGLQSSAGSRMAHFILDGRTHSVSKSNDGGATVDVVLHSTNRTVGVTYDVPLLRRYGVSVSYGDATAHPVTVVAPSVVSAVNGSESNLKVPPKLTPGLTALNEHNFGYLINVRDLCRTTSGLALVILVTTAVNHFAHRKAIRETWGSFAKNQPDVRLAFVMGRPADPAVQTAILHESLQFADIVQEDFLDTYRNLSLKSVMLLKWARDFCPCSRFVMKSDDDMFINVPNLLKYVRSLRGDRRHLFGRLVRGAKPVRSKSSKYHAPTSEYRDNVYPDYLSGTAYVMSADVAIKLYETSRTTPLFFLEDVFITGICAKKSGIARRNHTGFVYYKRPVKGCAYYKVISGHNNSPNDLKLIWKDLQKKDLKC